MQRFFLWIGFAAWLMAGLLPCGLAAAPVPQDDFKGWPAEWVKTYQRFERYIASRSVEWPASGLEFGPGGEIYHQVPDAGGPQTRLAIEFYREGRNFLGMVMNDALLAEGRDRLFRPGTFAASITFTSSLGYQNLIPVVWFETYAVKGDKNQRNEKLGVRMIAPPGKGDAIWPNERLLHFIDFSIFPDTYRNDIYRENKKAEPSVGLVVSRAGVVTRTKLEDRLEPLLRWRIYHDGKLMKSDAAAGEDRYVPDFGPGTYQILVGVEGPGGFMPVSNLLQFPLFPAVSGGFEVIPSDANKNKEPDFLESLSSPVQPPRPEGGSSLDSDGDGLTDGEEGGKEGASLVMKDSRNQQLADLWDTWSYELKAYPGSPEITSLNIK